MFDKVCLKCHKQFNSPSRNTRYCSQECCLEMNKKRRGRRKSYKKLAPRLRVDMQARKLARLIVESEIEAGLRKPECSVCKLTTEEAKQKKIQMEVHHIDGQVYNNLSRNLLYCCEPDHDRIEAKEVGICIEELITTIRGESHSRTISKIWLMEQSVLVLKTFQSFSSTKE